MGLSAQASPTPTEKSDSSARLMLHQHSPRLGAGGEGAGVEGQSHNGWLIALTATQAECFWNCAILTEGEIPAEHFL
jgi:hypothetical protein